MYSMDSPNMAFRAEGFNLSDELDFDSIRCINRWGFGNLGQCSDVGIGK